MGRRVCLAVISAEKVYALLKDRVQLEAFVEAYINRDITVINLDKALEGIVFVISGTVAADHEKALTNSLPFLPFKDNVSSLGIYYILPDGVMQLSDQLRQLDEQHFEARINLDGLIQNQVYPDVWGSSEGYNGKAYLKDHYKTLRAAIIEAAMRKEALVAIAE